MKRHRDSMLGQLFSFLLSPSMAAALALVGYYAFAGISNAVSPEGSLGGILIRIGTLFVILVAFMRFANRRNAVGLALLVPLAIFAIAYTLRIFDNFSLGFNSIPFTLNQVFLIFVVSGIIPAFLLSQIQGGIRSDQFMKAISLMCLLYLVGMALNANELLTSRSLGAGRIALEKINPIAMAHAAFAFIIFYVIVFRQSPRYFIEAAIFTPALLLIVLYTGSRGALVSGVITIALYVLLLKGTRRIWMAVSLIAVILIGFTYGLENFEGMIDRFDRLRGIGDGSTQKHLQAWTGAFQQFLDHPVTGGYIIEHSTNYYPHNIYLESLMAVGLVGSVPLFVHIALAFRGAFGIIRARKFSIVKMFIALFFVRESIALATYSSIWGANGFWVSSTLVIAFWYGRMLKRPYAATMKMMPSRY